MSDDKHVPESEPKFNYIEEKVMPKHKKRVKRFISSLFTTVFLAAVFGITARYVFIMSEPYFNKVLGLEAKEEDEVFRFPSATPTTEITPTVMPTPSSTPVPTPTPLQKDPKEEEEKVNQVQIIENYISATVDDYQKMHHEIMKVVNEAMSSYVIVTAIESGFDYFNESFEKKNSTTGVIITVNKVNLFIITSYSMIKDASLLMVEFHDGSMADAGIYSYDIDYDIAVLAVYIKELNEDVMTNMKQAEIDGSFSFQAGMPVIAIGSPNGNQGSVDIGIISRRAAPKSILDGKLDIYQISCAYYADNGGFILNLKGELMGCITHVHKENSSDEITTFVAINRLKPIIEKLISREDFIYFGIIAEDIPQEVLKEREMENGVFVTDVRPGSPAFMAGIRIGDIITNIDNYSIISVNAFVSYLNYYLPGDSALVKIKRSNTKQSYNDMEVTVILSLKE